MGVIFIKRKIRKGFTGVNGILMIVVAIVASVVIFSDTVKPQTISFKELTTHIESSNLEHVSVKSDGVTIYATLKDGSIVKTNNPNTESSNNIIYNSGLLVDQSAILSKSKGSGSSIIMLIITFVVISSIFASAKGGPGKSLFDEGIDTTDKDSDVKFDDVAGSDDSKEALKELVFYLKNPDKYKKFVSKAPKGAILYGPPGTGKTLLAKAVAGEASCSFISVTGSNFVDKFVGNGASRVRHLFAEAKKKKPCIVFIDEIDSIGGKRSSNGGGNDERHQTLNELLAAMNGFDDDDGVIVIGATNRLDTLDDALLRSGRFDTKVYIGLPDVKARRQIFDVHCKQKPISDDVDLNVAAKMTAGLSGADIENIMNKSGFYAAKEEADNIDMTHIYRAINHLVAGEEKKDRSCITEKDKKLTAYHEAGHALVAKIYAKTSVPKITIIPTTHGAGGYTIIDNPETAYMSKAELLNRIAIALGGRVAEEIIYGADNITTGASGDIQSVTNIVEGMIKSYGMSESFGMINVSNKHMLEKDILKESNAIVNSVYKNTLSFLKDNIHLLHATADRLIESETVLESEFEMVILQTKKED